jgi:hypothetical protein
MIVASFLLLCTIADSNAQTRIRFARGRYSATVTGTLSAGYYREYVVRARAGQSLIAKVTSGTGGVVIAESYESQYFLDLMEDGDYAVQIMNTGPRTWYRLTVTIIRTPR